jgi:26S proteasome regulatory subunit N2
MATAALSLLSEDDPALKGHALQRIWSVVDFHWAECSDELALFEELSEDETFQHRELAAAIASKCFYHLEEFDDAVRLALGAGKYFDVDAPNSEYVDAMIAKCVDTYIEHRLASRALFARINRKGDGVLSAAELDASVEHDVAPAELVAAVRRALAQSTVSTPAPGSQGRAGAKASGVDFEAFYACAARMPPSSCGVDPRMTRIVERMFQRCFDDGQYAQALGVALESQRLDMVRRALTAGDAESQARLLGYCFDFCHDKIAQRDYRHRVLRVLAECHRTSAAEPDHVAVCQCLQFLGDSPGVARHLDALLRAPQQPRGALIAFQVAFRVQENENQQFLRDVHAAMPRLASEVRAAAESDAAESDAAAAEAAAGPEDPAPTAGGAPAPPSRPEGKIDGTEPCAAGVDEAAEPEYAAALKTLKSILDGSAVIRIHLDFLCSHNRTDQLLLKRTMEAAGSRSSVLHNAVVTAHAYMNSGTTQDAFLRSNLEWLGRATNWAKFTAIGGLGVVHKGHLSESLALLQPYLPAQGEGAAAGAASAPFAEGGALYALGLIHVNKGWTDGGRIIEYYR